MNSDFLDHKEWHVSPEDYPMQFDQLPLELMNRHLSTPTPKGLSFLEECGIPKKIIKKYPGIEDRADAFDGAFTGFFIHREIENHRNSQNWLEELWIWHDNFKQKNFKGPFHYGLSEILRCCGQIELYKKVLAYLRERAAA